MTRDLTTHQPLMMMGLLSVLTHCIAAGFQSSSALKKDLLTPANEQRMTICVELLGLLFNDDDGIPEMIFMSGLINSAVQLLDSNKL